MVGGFVAGVGIFILVLAIIEILAGLGAMFGKGFGRILGILYSLLFGSFLLIGLASGERAAASASTDANVGAGFIFFLVMFLMYLYAALVLKSHHVYFDTASMLVSLLVIGRAIEGGAKRKAHRAVHGLLQLSAKGAEK